MKKLETNMLNENDLMETVRRFLRNIGYEINPRCSGIKPLHNRRQTSLQAHINIAAITAPPMAHSNSVCQLNIEIYSVSR